MLGSDKGPEADSLRAFFVMLGASDMLGSVMGGPRHRLAGHVCS